MLFLLYWTKHYFIITGQRAAGLQKPCRLTSGAAPGAGSCLLRWMGPGLSFLTLQNMALIDSPWVDPREACLPPKKQQILVWFLVVLLAFTTKKWWPFAHWGQSVTSNSKGTIESWVTGMSHFVDLCRTHPSRWIWGETRGMYVRILCSDGMESVCWCLSLVCSQRPSRCAIAHVVNLRSWYNNSLKSQSVWHCFGLLPVPDRFSNIPSWWGSSCKVTKHALWPAKWMCDAHSNVK